MGVAILFRATTLLDVAAVANRAVRHRDVRGQHHCGGWRRRIGALVDRLLGFGRAATQVCAIPFRGDVAYWEEANAKGSCPRQPVGTRCLWCLDCTGPA